MKDLIKRFFSPSSDGATSPADERPHDIRIATCALFLEMANIDEEFSDVEREHVLGILMGEYELSEEHAKELANAAHEELSGSIDLWRFTNLINQNYTKEEKMSVVELIWKVVYADGHLSAHEDYLVHRLGKMLRLSNKELIDAKLAVLHDSGGDE